MIRFGNMGDCRAGREISRRQKYTRLWFDTCEVWICRRLRGQVVRLMSGERSQDFDVLKKLSYLENWPGTEMSDARTYDVHFRHQSLDFTFWQCSFLQGHRCSLKNTKKDCWYIMYTLCLSWDIQNTTWLSNTQAVFLNFPHVTLLTFSRSRGYILSSPLYYT